MTKTHSGILIVACLILSFCISAFDSSWISLQYKQENFKLLNALAHVETNQVLDYYTGTIEENVTGPLRFLFSGIAFLIFALTFLCERSLKTFSLSVFFYFLISRPEVLTFPPYGDPLSGPWAEALWLYKNHFDYVGLFHQPEYAQGGPKVYLFTLYPTCLALLMKLIPSTKLFLIINHLMTFMMSAWVVGLIRKIAQNIFQNREALLLSLILLFLPLFQASSELLNMEMPSTFFSVVCFYLLTQKQFARALLCAIAATLMKAPGLIACAAVAASSFFWAIEDKKGRIKNSIILLISVLFALFFIYLKGFVNENPLPHNAIKFLAGVPHLIHCPIIISLSLFSVLILFIFMTSHVIHRRKNFLPHFWIPLVSILFILGWLSLYLNFSVLGPRYKLLLSPFLVLSTGYAVYHILPMRRIFCYGCYLLSVFLLCSIYGQHYGHRIESTYYNYSLLERSLEYRNDLKMHQKLGKVLHENFPGFMVGAPFITAQTLSIPEFGYNKKPIDTVMYGMSITYADHVHKFKGIENLDHFKTIWIGFKSAMKLGYPYPIDPKDRIVEEVVVGNKKATLFYGGVAIDRTLKIILLKQHGRL